MENAKAYRKLERISETSVCLISSGSNSNCRDRSAERARREQDGISCVITLYHTPQLEHKFVRPLTTTVPPTLKTGHSALGNPSVAGWFTESMLNIEKEKNYGMRETLASTGIKSSRCQHVLRVSRRGSTGDTDTLLGDTNPFLPRVNSSVLRDGRTSWLSRRGCKYLYNVKQDEEWEEGVAMDVEGIHPFHFLLHRM